MQASLSSEPEKLTTAITLRNLMSQQPHAAASGRRDGGVVGVGGVGGGVGGGGRGLERISSSPTAVAGPRDDDGW
jgi:hypothetical protein